MDGRPGKLRRVCVFVAAGLAFAGVLLAGGELFARALWGQPVRPWVSHPFWQVARPPTYHALRHDIDRPGERFEYEVNPLGLRGRSLKTLEKPAATYRVIFLGGSTTENASTPEDATFPALVEKGLNDAAAGRIRVEVGNAGIQGGRTAHTLAQLAIRIPPLKPDLVVVLEGQNDLLDSLRPGFDPTTYDLASPTLPTLGDWLFANSRLYAVVSIRYGTFREKDQHPTLRQRAKTRRSRPMKPLDRDVLWNLPAFEGALRRTAALAAELPARLVFMTQPTLYKPSMTAEEDAVLWMGAQAGMNIETPVLVRGMEGYNDAVRRIAAERGALLVDLDREVPKDLKHFIDDVHLTREGNAAIARAVLAVLGRADVPPRNGH